jgi:hypothetical protein
MRAAVALSVKRIGDGLAAEFEQRRRVFAAQPSAHSSFQTVESEAGPRTFILDELAVQAGEERHIPNGGGAMSEFHFNPNTSCMS